MSFVNRFARILSAAACAAGVLSASADAAWGLKYEVSKNGVDWSPSVNAFAGETVYFRFGAYFDVGTKITTADGTGNAIAMTRFTGQNRVDGLQPGDFIQNVQPAIQAHNAALLAVNANLIGGTGITSFGSQLILQLAPYALNPETSRPIYTGQIQLGQTPGYRELSIRNNQYGAGATPGLTFYHDLSVANRQSGKPDDAGARADLNATVIVNCAPPTIGTPPAPATVCVGGPVQFSVAATGTGVLEYQWRKNTNPIDGATSSTLSILSVSAGDAGSYDCIVTDDCASSTSVAAALTVSLPPVIHTQPVSTVARPGTTATMSLIATTGDGTGSLQYAWRKGVNPLSNGGRISGADTPILSITGAQVGDAGDYSCVVTDPTRPACAPIISSIAHLSVGDCTVSWQQVASTGPGARRSPSIAYDSARNRLVLFGGTTATETKSDTWEWDGSTWSLRSTAGPGARNGHALAYDALHGRTLLFGGYNASGVPQADTWSWDGTTWTRVATTGPTARFYANMSYDSVRQEVILFGGLQQDYGLPTDTWAWSGSFWTKIATTGPSGRYAGAMAFDAVRQRMVLFGGFNVASINFSDTWEWDGAAWSMRASGTPTARTGASLAFDPGRGRIIMFGGRLQVEDEISWSSRTWEWDGTTWVSNLTGTPNARWLAGMTLDTLKQRIVLFGGEDTGGNPLGDTWELASRIPITQQPTSVVTNFGQNAVFNVVATGTGLGYQWRRNGVPVLNDARISGATAATLQISQVGLQDEGSYDVIISSVCGQEISQQATLSVASCPSSWQDLSASEPGPRWLGDAAADVFRKQIVLFGGFATPTGGRLGDTWIWNGTGWSQRAVPGPSPRNDHAMTSLASGVLLFGGREANGNINLNDTWYWNGTSWTLLNPAHRPPARAGHAMVYDTARNRVVLFGGVHNGDVLANDTWEWDGTDWMQVSSSGPSVRFAFQMTFDVARGRTVLFGGALFFGTVFTDTWEWDGAAWTKKSDIGPPGPVYGQMIYDPARARSVYVTGYTHNRVYSTETWEWNGLNWSKTLNVSPPPRQGAYGAYDHQRSRIVLFGGYTPAITLLADSWGLVLGPSVISPPQNQTLRSGQTAIFSVTGSAPGLQYQWLRNGVNVANGGRISGATTNSLSISQVIAPDGGSYRVRATDACGSSVISTPAILTVTCTADFNFDGVVDDSDFQLFITAYDKLLCDPAPTPCPVDMNADGFVDDLDFQLFITQYNDLLCP
ncbi:MAG: immunoglobulin domain-containing protein [Phycisphaerae bacterium]|nr:immunoglobulin domain-containing protein [Phycisphaerae bacterium]